MILVIPTPPTPGAVVVGILAVLGAALVTALSIMLGRRSRNWLHYIAAAGGLVVVAGVVGQRTADDGAAQGPWNAGISVPVLGVRLDAVTAAGLIVVLVGTTLVLLFERVPQEDERHPPLVHRRLEDDDAV